MWPSSNIGSKWKQRGDKQRQTKRWQTRIVFFEKSSKKRILCLQLDRMPAAGGKLPPNWREEVFQPSCQLPDRWLALFYKSTIALQSIGYMNHGCHKFTHNGRDVSYTRWTIKRARTSFYFSLQISPSLSFLCEVQSQSKTCKVVRISAIYCSTLIHFLVSQIPTKVTLKRNNHLPDKSFWGQKPNSSKLDLM